MCLLNFSIFKGGRKKFNFLNPFIGAGGGGVSLKRETYQFQKPFFTFDSWQLSRSAAVSSVSALEGTGDAHSVSPAVRMVLS